MLKRLGKYLVPSKHRTRDHKAHARYAAGGDGMVGHSYGSDNRTHLTTSGLIDPLAKGPQSGLQDDALLLTDIDLDDDFNLLEDSPDGGRTYYSGGRDAAGQRETVRWEGVGLIRTPRSRSRPVQSRSNAVTEVSAMPVAAIEGPAVEKEEPSVAKAATAMGKEVPAVVQEATPMENKVPVVAKGPAIEEKVPGTKMEPSVVQREVVDESVPETLESAPANENVSSIPTPAPACYRELRTLRNKNRSSSISKHNKMWQVAREVELDRLLKQWIEYRKRCRGGYRRARRTWCKPESTIDLRDAKEFSKKIDRLSRSFSDAALERHTSQSTSNNVSGAGKHRLSEHPRGVFQDGSLTSRSSGGRCMDARRANRTFDGSFDEELRSADGRHARHKRAQSVTAFCDKIPAARQLPRSHHREAGRTASGNGQKGRMPGRLEPAFSGKCSRSTTQSKAAPLKAACTGGQRRDSQQPLKPLKSSAATPRGAKSQLKASGGAPVRIPREGKLVKRDSSKGKSAFVPQRPPVMHNSTKSRTASSSGFSTPRGGCVGVDTGTPRSNLSTPRGTPRSHRRPERGGSDSGPRRGLQGKSAPSPRPGIGPAARVPMQHKPGAVLKNGYGTPRDAKGCPTPRNRPRSPLRSARHLPTGPVGGLGARTNRRAIGAFPHGLPTPTRVK